MVGLGPGRADWCTPAVAARLASATEIVGYSPYVDHADRIIAAMQGGPSRATRHRSDNRVEADRARLALDLAAHGAADVHVVVVSSGDPGVFAMASAVLEQLDAEPDRWREVEVDIEPGITAAQAVASRVGAPLGHDFCVISLSDVLKPWETIERRLDAAAAADFVVAMYNPRSRQRPHQFADAMAVLARHRDPATPVVLGRNVGRDTEEVVVVDLASVDPETVDMSTVVVVGSSATRVLDRPTGCSVYTPRRAR